MDTVPQCPTQSHLAPFFGHFRETCIPSVPANPASSRMVGWEIGWEFLRRG